jgi:hypothetical protein
MGAAHGAEGSFGAVHEIGAGAAVDVQIDKARREETALQIDDFDGAIRETGTIGQNVRNAPLFHNDGTTEQKPVRENNGAVREEPGMHGDVVSGGVVSGKLIYRFALGGERETINLHSPFTDSPNAGTETPWS